MNDFKKYDYTELVKIFSKDEIEQAIELTKVKYFDNFLEENSDVFDEVFPDHWEAGFFPSHNWFYPYIVVKFDEFTITNSEGYEHTIRDLFVFLEFNINTIDYPKVHFSSINILGIRRTYTEKELFCNYSHSHLSFSLNEIERFCLGTGPLATMRIEGKKLYNDKDYLVLFLNQIKEFVKWESLEGSPYISIRNINSRSGRVNMYNDYNYPRLSETLKKVLEKLNYNIDVTFLNGRIKLDSFDDSLDKAVIYDEEGKIRNFYDKSGNLIDYCVKNEKGEYYKYLSDDETDSEINDIITEDDDFIFRGTNYRITVIKEEKEEKSPDLYLNPYFKKQILNILERELEKILIRKHLGKLIKI